MKPNSNTIINPGLIPFTHLSTDPTLEPLPNSSFSMEPQFIAPLQVIVPSKALTNLPSVPHKRPIKRSNEMVRIPHLNLQDQLHFQILVRKTRIIFESLRIFFSRERESHQHAASSMSAHGLWLNRHKRIIGSIPGVNVGDIFFYRIELLIIGLHGRNIASVDYVPATYSDSGEPIATSIIILSRDKENCDNGEELIYTCPIKRSQKANKHNASQKLEEDILALERSMINDVEVRVIRDMRCDCSPTKKVYIYDGLYKIVQCLKEKASKSVFDIYKFKLSRIKGQEETCSSKIIKATNMKVSPQPLRPGGHLSLDLSNRQERFPILLFNDIDMLDDPSSYQYTTRPLYDLNVYDEVFKKTRHGCKCVAICREDCYCATMNGGELPYDVDGILKRGKPVIYECGRWCGCPSDCGNRVTQRGIKKSFEVFRDLTTEWGVRSLDFIRAGSFLFEMNGHILTEEEVKSNSVEYKRNLVHPEEFPPRWREWGNVSDLFPDYLDHNHSFTPELKFSIDVSMTRGVAAYLSHSGVSPNVFVQSVLYDHHDHAYPHLMVFASENIPPLRELSFDYGR